MLMNYYRQMERSRIQFDFMVHREEEGHYDREIERLGGKLYRLPPIRPGNYRYYFEQLSRFFREHTDYRVVHSHINENSSFVLGAAKRSGIPCRIAHSHLSDLGIDYKLPFRLYARWSMKDGPNQFFACSQHAGNWLFGRSKPVTVLHNAVDVREFSFDQGVRDRIRDEIGAGQKLVLGHIGRFNKQKNHGFLIDLFKVVHSIQPESMLVMAGDGPLRPMIEKKVMELGLSSSVQFLGVREDIPMLMQGFDLFVFPSYFEGLPVVLVEAQAAGLSCIVSDTITKEADVTGRLHFIDLKASPEQWATRILALPSDHVDTSSVMATRGYDTVTTAKWLMDYYLLHSRRPINEELGLGRIM